MDGAQPRRAGLLGSCRILMWWKLGSHWDICPQVGCDKDKLIMVATIWVLICALCFISVTCGLFHYPAVELGDFVLCGSGRGDKHLAQGHLATKREGEVWTQACLVPKSGLFLLLPDCLDLGSRLSGADDPMGKERLAQVVVTATERGVGSGFPLAHPHPTS